MAAIAPRYVQRTPRRIVRTYAPGAPGGSILQGTSAAATDPSLSIATTTPPRVSVLGIDSAQVSVTLPALAAGQSTTVNFVMGLPNVSTWPQSAGQRSTFQTSRQPVSTFSLDNILFNVSANVSLPTDVGGVVTLLGVVSQGAALGSNGQTFYGPTLAAGNYKAFQVTGYFTLYATSTYNGGDKATVTGSGTLHLQPR